MKLRIRGRDVAMTKVLRAHIDRRIGFALGRFGERIGQVVVTFSKGKGLRSKERVCQIDAALRPRSVRVEDSDKDAFAAVNHAANRLSRSIGRALAEQGVLADRPLG